MSDDISREHEPSGFGRVFGTLMAAMAVAGLGWAATRGRDRDPVTAQRRDRQDVDDRDLNRRDRDGRMA